MKTWHLHSGTIAVLVVAVLLAGSCSKRDNAPESIRSVSFQVADGFATLPGAAVPTRVTPYNSTDKLGDDSFGVLAYTLSAPAAPAAEWTLYQTPVEALYRSDSGKWAPNPPVYWPGNDEYIRFFAYAPYEGVTATAATGVAPSIAFAVNADVADQQDLVVAVPSPRGDNPVMTELNVPLTFRHALAGVRFKIGTGLTVSSVTISGAYDAGTLDMGSLAWSSLEKSGNVYTLDTPAVTTVGDYDYFDEALTLMMIPQTLPAGTEITAVVDGNTITADISAHSWVQGKVMTYIIARASSEQIPTGGITITGQLLDWYDFTGRFPQPGDDSGSDPDPTAEGRFSVSPTKKFTEFAPGNLVATLTNGGTTIAWSFAEHQWEYLGPSNVLTTGADGKVDLFEWSSSFPGNYGLGLYPNNTFSSTFQDWGSNPSLIASLGSGWYTLTAYEWDYLCPTEENNGRETQFGLATVHGIAGLVILPDADQWTLPAGIPEFKYYTQCVDNGFNSNNYTDTQWDMMETAGAVFLPASGYRQIAYHAEPEDPYEYSNDWNGTFGGYWSATDDDEYAIAAAVTSDIYSSKEGYSFLQGHNPKRYGFSVRLVR